MSQRLSSGSKRHFHVTVTIRRKTASASNHYSKWFVGVFAKDDDDDNDDEEEEEEEVWELLPRLDDDIESDNLFERLYFII